MKFAIEQIYQRVDLDRFVATYFSEEFNNSILADIGMQQRQLIEHQTTSEGFAELIRWVPTFQLPKKLAKLAGTSEVSYHERSTYNPATGLLSFTIEHPFQKRLAVTGTIDFADHPQGVRQRVTTEVRLSVFGIRTIVERLIESELKKSYALKHKIMQDYLDQTGAVSNKG